MTPAAFGVLTLCVYRLTRLIVEDSILNPARDWLLRQTNRPRTGKTAAWVYDLIDCPWCTSVHVALWALVASWAAGMDVYGLVGFGALWWALAGAAGLVTAVEDRLSGDEP